MEIHRPVGPLENCHEWIPHPAQTRPMLKLRAYCGDASAREVAPWTGNVGGMVLGPCGWESVAALDLPHFLRGLLRLAEDLPNVAVSEACRTPCHDPDGERWGACSFCQGTGLRITKTPASRYLSIRIGLALGRAASEGHPPGSAHPYGGVAEACWPGEAFDALDACERWTWCPCSKNEAAWKAAAPNHMHSSFCAALWQLCFHGPRKGLTRSFWNLLEQSLLLKPKAIREIVCGEILATAG